MGMDFVPFVTRDEVVAFLDELKKELQASIEQLDYILLSSKSMSMDPNQYLKLNHAIQTLLDVQKSRVEACDSALIRLNCGV